MERESRRKIEAWHAKMVAPSPLTPDLRIFSTRRPALRKTSNSSFKAPPPPSHYRYTKSTQKAWHLGDCLYYVYLLHIMLSYPLGLRFTLALRFPRSPKCVPPN